MASAILGVSVMALAFAVPAEAQTRPGGERGNPEARIEQRVQHMTQQLDLSAEQQAQIRSILQRQAARTAEARPQRTDRQQPARARGNEQMRERMQAHQAALNEILTPAQRGQLAAIRAEMRANPQQARQNRGSHLDQLDLTDAQKAQIAELRKNQRAEMGQARGPGDRGSMRGQRPQRDGAAEWGQHGREMAAAIEAVLTPEQRQKWQELRRDRSPQREGRMAPRGSRSSR
jgi:periplasmic protein CpxP/Spy